MLRSTVMWMCSDIKLIVSPQAKFDAIPPKDVGGVANVPKAKALRKILAFCRNNCTSRSSYHYELGRFGIPVKRPFQKCIVLSLYDSEVMAKLTKACGDIEILTVPPPPPPLMRPRIMNFFQLNEIRVINFHI